MKKRIFISLLVLISVITFLVIRSCSNNNTINKQTTQSSLSTNWSQSKSVSSSTKQNKSESETAVRDEATETLEKSDGLLGDEETEKVKTSLEVAFDYLTQVSDQSDVQVTYKDKLSVTSQSMAQTVVTMLKASYQIDEASLKVYASNSENVFQFTVDLVKEGTDNLTLAGNYVTGTQQLEIASLHGTPTGIQY